MGILEPIHVCSRNGYFETNSCLYFETLNPNPNSICQTLKPKSIKSPNPQTITNEGTFNLKKKEKIEQINRKKIKKKEGFKKWVELEARKVCFLIFF